MPPLGQLISFFLLAFAVCVSAKPLSDVPATKKLIPGPGLPTLEELGITIEDLAKFRANRTVRQLSSIRTCGIY